MIGSYWALYTDAIDGFVDGSMVVGTNWPINLSYAELDAPVDAVEPSEGMTGWADTWMISANAPHPNCMLQWMDWTMQPDVQAEVAVYYGAAGSNVGFVRRDPLLPHRRSTARAPTRPWTRSGTATAATRSSWTRSILWKTPSVDCGDDRGEVCIDYSEWTQAWTEIVG